MDALLTGKTDLTKTDYGGYGGQGLPGFGGPCGSRGPSETFCNDQL